MKSKVSFVVDSTTIVTEKMQREYRFYTVPLNVSDGKTSRHETDISDEEIYSIVEDPELCKHLKSSSPAPGDFADAYEKLFAEGYDDIIVFTLSKEVSGTYQTAIMAKDLIEDESKSEHVFVINTLLCNYGVINGIQASLPFLSQDITTEQLVEKINENFENSNLMFTILDLKHLFRGGRLNKLSCAIGLLFKIKPVIEMVDGKLVLAYKMRTKVNVVDLFMKRISEFSLKYKKVYLRFVDLNNIEVIEQMKKMVAEKFSNVIISNVSRVGPVFNVHLGTQGFGISLTGVNE